jgi:hypothetical protein
MLLSFELFFELVFTKSLLAAMKCKIRERPMEKKGAQIKYVVFV